MQQEGEETPCTPARLGDGILENGVDQGAARRALVREANTRRQQAEADKDAQKGQDRAERPQRATQSPGSQPRRSEAAVCLLCPCPGPSGRPVSSTLPAWPASWRPYALDGGVVRV